MSFQHIAAIAKLKLPKAIKATLTWAAYHACRGCGRAWAGAELISEESCQGVSTVRRAFEDLRQRQLLVGLEYLKGGRARATEYAVVPSLLRFPDHGVCPSCGKEHPDLSRHFDDKGNPLNAATYPLNAGGYHSINPLNAGGYRDHGGNKPSQREQQNPLALRDQQSVRTEQSINQADPPPSASGSASPRSFEPPITKPESSEDARRAGIEADRWLTPTPSPVRGYSVIHGAQERPPDRDEAEESRQDTKHPPETDASEG